MYWKVYLKYTVGMYSMTYFLPQKIDKFGSCLDLWKLTLLLWWHILPSKIQSLAVARSKINKTLPNLSVPCMLPIVPFSLWLLNQQSDLKYSCFFIYWMKYDDWTIQRYCSCLIPCYYFFLGPPPFHLVLCCPSVMIVSLMSWQWHPPQGR